jgi:hypothetical protein
LAIHLSLTLAEPFDERRLSGHIPTHSLALGFLRFLGLHDLEILVIRLGFLQTGISSLKV